MPDSQMQARITMTDSPQNAASNTLHALLHTYRHVSHVLCCCANHMYSQMQARSPRAVTSAMFIAVARIMCTAKCKHAPHGPSHQPCSLLLRESWQGPQCRCSPRHGQTINALHAGHHSNTLGTHTAQHAPSRQPCSWLLRESWQGLQCRCSPRHGQKLEVGWR